MALTLTKYEVTAKKAFIIGINQSLFNINDYTYFMIELNKFAGSGFGFWIKGAPH